MTQFLVLAYDGTDPDAPARRANARAAHLAGVGAMVDKGELVAGGPILDEADTVIGSVALVEVASRAELDAWLAREPYVRAGVWKDVDIKPVRLVVRDGKIMP